uniref:DIX domain-containing protein n=1 Tax=Acrobeloides nanus TaxID=290746 RepID=A0A914DP08_9BILA
MSDEVGDSSTVADTIIEGTSRLNLKEGSATPSSSYKNGFNGDSCDIDMRSDISTSNSQKAGSSASGSALNTKVYYHIDDEPTPYCTEVPIPPDKITLGDFKRVLNRSNFKFYCKAIDPEVGGEVKAELRDDSQILQRSSNGQFELFLLTAEGSSHSDGGTTVFSKNMRYMVPGPAPSSLYPVPNFHHYGQQQFSAYNTGGL